MEQSITPANDTAPPPPERRQHPRLPVDTHATLLLIEAGLRLSGRLLNLSFGGCLILTDNRFPTGVYRRVEVEFTLQGISFRVAGVTQGVYDRRRVGVRFLDVSERKREQLLLLLREIAETIAPEPPPEAGA